MHKVFTYAVAIVLLCLTALRAKDKDILTIGETAPDFTMVASDGDTVRLSDFAGRFFVVLFFYPSDDSPGCINQLSAVRNDYAAFIEKGTKIFGVNPADRQSHSKFANRYNFQFPLLVDEGGKIAEKYGCGGGFWVKRTVYVIDPNGVIIFAKRGLPLNKDILKAIPDEL